MNKLGYVFCLADGCGAKVARGNFCTYHYWANRRTDEYRASKRRDELSNKQIALRFAADRRLRHAFDEEDEAHYQATDTCGWCGRPFGTNTKHIDHDHRCCRGKRARRHCYRCTRGIVHNACNADIARYEWAEREFGLTHERLQEYRDHFPVPRQRTSTVAPSSSRIG